jgi:SAM-dependent methyltransferase|tara:strand:- start:208 stop:960 length:753 start_codon:yes stop_codon:yes gene_type:complete
MLNRQQEYQKMSVVECNHWWYKTLHKLVLESLFKYIPDRNSNILDAGCGSGGLITFLNSYQYKNIKGFDLSDDAVDLSKEKKLNVVHGDIKDIESIISKQNFDAIISNDTLYFLKSREIIKFMYSCSNGLRSGGVLILNIPVFKAFRGIHDISVGIQKRFSRQDYNIFLSHKDFRVVRKTFWPFLLSPFIFITRLVQRFKYGFLNPEIKSDSDLPNPLINNFLYRITLLEVNNIKHSIFGSSLFIVLQKK